MGEHSKIAVIIHSLCGGGSEHAAALMASHWASEGRDVTLITLDSVSSDCIAVHDSVNRVGLDLLSESSGPIAALLANRDRVRALRKAITDSGATKVISLTDRMNVLTILACRRSGLKPIVAERTDPRHHRIGKVWDFLRRCTYPKAGAIVVQTESVRQATLPMAGTCPVVVIPNAVLEPDSESGLEGKFDDSRRWICGVGRLSAEKGFDRIISTFAGVAADAPDWSLAIAGDGPQREELEAIARKLSISERVQFMGWRENPWQSLSNAEVFVLASHYEGFPNALLEAMARGKACVAVDCESGPREIIRDGENGLLISGNSEGEILSGLRQSLLDLLSDKSLRLSIGQNARNVVDEFSVARHFQAWDEIDG